MIARWCPWQIRTLWDRLQIAGIVSTLFSFRLHQCLYDGVTSPLWPLLGLRTRWSILEVKSLQLRWNRRICDFQTSSSDLTWGYDTRKKFPAITARVICPIQFIQVLFIFGPILFIVEHFPTFWFHDKIKTHRCFYWMIQGCEVIPRFDEQCRYMECWISIAISLVY